MYEIAGWTLLVILAGALEILGMIEALRHIADLREFVLFILVLFGPLAYTLAVFFPGVPRVREWTHGGENNLWTRGGVLHWGGLMLYMLILQLVMGAGLAFYTLMGGIAQALLFLAGVHAIRAVESRLDSTERKEEGA